MTDGVQIVSASQDETEAVADRLGRSLGRGDVVLLYGDLGAGKTAFVRGLARGVGAGADEVSSPTFTLVQEYAGGRVTLYHADLYRLDPAEAEDLGLDELAAAGVLAVEWADRWAGRPIGAIEIWLDDEGEDRRRIRVCTPGAGRHAGGADITSG